jgi:hypothetical protein
MSRAERIAAQLGVPQGTANSKLRKQLLFKYVQKAKDNVCYRCLKKIETVDDLSIEHIEPWEGRDAELFWDLNNIAFSHTRCNRPHTNGAERLRKVGPTGTSWCCRCKEFLPSELFGTKPSRYNGLADYCKKCAAVMKNESRKRLTRF